MVDAQQNTSALPAEPEKRRGSLFRAVLPFRSSRTTSPRNSIDTGASRSSLDLDQSDAKPRKLSRPFNSTSSTTTRTDSSISGGGNKLRKKSILTLENTRKTTDDGWDRDKITGERKDPTNMIHSLAHEFDVPKAGKVEIIETGEPARPASEIVSKLPAHLWTTIISSLSLAEEASLSLSCKPFRDICSHDILRQLNDPNNFRERCQFLYYLNHALPNHLLCYVCGLYHVRTSKGDETLRPTNIANPLFLCPYATSNDPAEKMSRTRITFGRHLPYSFVQLALRYCHHGPSYGLPYDKLGRRYKDKPEIGQWLHQTRWAIIDDHLYMRVVSTAFVTPNLPPAGKRHLLYSREDFVPFFSVCAHWRDGELMPVCRCALDHVPAPLSGSGLNRVMKEAQAKWLTGPQSRMVSMCENCKPMRRCPECPTEYLIEMKMQEDRGEQELTKLFKYAIVVTRWSDLGDGSAPWTPEWAAINGYLDNLPKQERYDSFKTLGRRAISGTFESFFNPEQIPPARMVNLNPNGERLGEKGHNWY